MTIKEILKAKNAAKQGNVSVASVYKVGEQVEREAELAKRKEIDKAWREHRRA